MNCEMEEGGGGVEEGVVVYVERSGNSESMGKVMCDDRRRSWGWV